MPTEVGLQKPVTGLIAMAPVQEDSPLMKAWVDYTNASEGLTNALRWIYTDPFKHGEGSLWGAFAAGFAASVALREPAARDVVAAVRRDPDGRVWLCRRNGDGAHGGLAGMWEYPGGKVEPGEHLRDALARELQEEFDVAEVSIGRVLDSIDDCKTPATGENVYRVTFFEVEMPEPTELKKHTEARWMTPDEACAVEQLPSGTMFNGRHFGRFFRPPPTCGSCGCSNAVSHLRSGKFLELNGLPDPLCSDCFRGWYENAITDPEILRRYVLSSREKAAREAPGMRADG